MEKNMSKVETPLGGANIVNLPVIEKVHSMTDTELQRYLQAVQEEIQARKLKRAEELIDKVCIMLNELSDLGIHLLVEDCFGDQTDVTNCAERFSPEHFKAWG